MIDIKILRDDPERVKANYIRRGGGNVDVDELHKIDREYLEQIHRVEELRKQRNDLSKQCRDNPDARVQVKEIKTELGEREAQMSELKGKIDEGLSWLPNFLDPSVPDGGGDHDNAEFKVVGDKTTFDFEPRDHQALGDLLGIIDTKRGAKVAQSGFYYWKGKGAQLAQSVFFWAQKELAAAGFTVFMTPCAAKSDTLFGTGYLPFFADESYNLVGEDLALIGTSEQTLIGYHADEILDTDTLPLKYTAFTPCFRTEAGSYGKESRGIFRVHQFHKVEQIIFCKPENSPTMHEHCQVNAAPEPSALREA